VPEHLANLSNSDDDATADIGAVKSSITSSSLKRPTPPDPNDSGVEAKIEKPDDSVQAEPNSDSYDVEKNVRIKLIWKRQSSNSQCSGLNYNLFQLLCPSLRVLSPRITFSIQLSSSSIVRSHMVFKYHPQCQQYVFRYHVFSSF
ncbi:hypothetical protein GCK32_020461, partial [Trichostrongylus colubriformis]